MIHPCIALALLNKTHRCRGSKVDFVRVDQLWDSSIHNYKLTETAEDADADEYDQYVFTVRRKFDWENKYTETVVDIKSKLLKEALTHVMGAVKGCSAPLFSFAPYTYYYKVSALPRRHPRSIPTCFSYSLKSCERT